MINHRENDDEMNNRSHGHDINSPKSRQYDDACRY